MIEPDDLRASQDTVTALDNCPPPAVAAAELLGLPTASSIALNVAFEGDSELFVEYGEQSGAYPRRTEVTSHAGNSPFVLGLEGLSSDTGYFYRIRWRVPGCGPFAVGPEHGFHTARPPGQPFVFTIQADPHLDGMSDLDLYRQTLRNQLADAPDFMIDLGDTFMCEKFPEPFTSTVQMAPDNGTVIARYLYERQNFGVVAHSVPLFLVNGNHEGEAGWLSDGTANNLAVWTTLARKAYYFAAVPDGFYSGSSTEIPFVGVRGSYYAWQWGDALFVVLDPFWYTTKKSNHDAWVWTLGEEQYRWLASTLAGSTASLRFVFIHNLVGGLDGQARGGIEGATFFEWGGANLDGTDGFAAHRPGWAKPIHRLLVEHRVAAVFHGHDHLYAKQELDGIVYQEVPQPSSTNFNSGPILAAEAHYANGTILGSSGHLRVQVGPTEATIAYVSSYRPIDENGRRHNRDIADSYVVRPR